MDIGFVDTSHNHQSSAVVVQFSAMASVVRSFPLRRHVMRLSNPRSFGIGRRGLATLASSSLSSFSSSSFVFPVQNSAPSLFPVRRRPFTSSPSSPSQKNQSSSSSSSSDPPVWTVWDRYLPASWIPYVQLSRLDKPIGTWLLLWPCAWSSAAAGGMTGNGTDILLLSQFAVGALAMRGAGCTINDWWDRDLDQRVARTAQRPLARGAVTPTQALGWCVAQTTVGLGVLLSLPHVEACFGWGAAALPLVLLYPTTKRFFASPQLVLGLAMNWGVFMGWVATHGSLVHPEIVLPLYTSGVTWTLVYDTIYAHQDKNDDARLGLQSTALTFGRDDEQQARILHGLAAATYLQWLAVGYGLSSHAATDFAWIPYGTGVTAAYAHLVWQIHTADFNDPHNLMQRFRANTQVGGIVFAALVAAGWF